MIRLSPINFEKSFDKLKKQTDLTDTEQALHDALMTVSGDSPWHIAIKDVYIDFTVEKFRSLICDLLSQEQDCPDTMFRILGSRAYYLLLVIKNKHTHS